MSGSDGFPSDDSSGERKFSSRAAGENEVKLGQSQEVKRRFTSVVEDFVNLYANGIGNKGPRKCIIM